MALAAEHERDLPVIQAARQGDAYAFEELVRRHGRWVRGVIFAVLGDSQRVDDVAQQVWTSAWEQIGKLRKPDRWRGWLCRLARNAALDAGRQKTRDRQLFQPIPEPGPPVAIGDSPIQTVARDEQRRLILRAIRGLPVIYREPLVLRYLEGWSYQQIADVLELPFDTVETRLVRARRLLRDAVKDKF